MRNRDHNNKNDHGFEFVSYIYGELNLDERHEFETHLATCDECAMELASYSDARLGVIEWRREDFDHLVTPAIVVPWATQNRTAEVVENEAVGAFSRFLEALGSLPIFAKAGMGLAMASLAVGVVYFAVFLPSGEKNVAVNEKTDAESVSSPERKSGSDVGTPFIAGRDERTETRDVGPATSDHHVRRQFVVARFSDHRSPVRRSELATKKAPRLTSVDEEDDKTLRLADLFAEIGTSE